MPQLVQNIAALFQLTPDFQSNRDRRCLYLKLLITLCMTYEDSGQILDVCSYLQKHTEYEIPPLQLYTHFVLTDAADFTSFRATENLAL